MKQILTFILMLSTTILSGQDSNQLTLGGYADGYYAWFSNGDETALQQHNSTGSYHNNFGINIAQLSAAYDSKSVRGKATVHFGDIPQIAWANQYRFIQEANAGVRIWDSLWIDIGAFHTHVGTESFLPKNNLLSTITLATYYGPFYQSGVRLSYDIKKWHFELHGTNGYNLHIDNNTGKTIGALINYEASEKLNLTYSGMCGREQTGLLNDDVLLYQNAYVNSKLGKFTLQAGVDVASILDDGGTSSWELIGALATVKYRATKTIAITGRYEFFNDPLYVNSVDLFGAVDTFGQQNLLLSAGYLVVHGVTVGVEYKPSENGFLRIEVRGLQNQEREDFEPENPTDFSSRAAGLNPAGYQRLEAVATIGVYFDKAFNLGRD